MGPMNDSSIPGSGDRLEPEPASPARSGRHRTAALVVGGVLLFAGGAGTGAVVGSSLSPASASTSQSGQGGPGGTGGTGGAPGGQSQDGGSGTAPSGAPSAMPSTAPSTSTS